VFDIITGFMIFYPSLLCLAQIYNLNLHSRDILLRAVALNQLLHHAIAGFDPLFIGKIGIG